MSSCPDGITRGLERFNSACAARLKQVEPYVSRTGAFVVNNIEIIKTIAIGILALYVGYTTPLSFFLGYLISWAHSKELLPCIDKASDLFQQFVHGGVIPEGESDRTVIALSMSQCALLLLHPSSGLTVMRFGFGVLLAKANHAPNSPPIESHMPSAPPSLSSS